MKTYSTKQVCEIVGIGRQTLLRWLRDGKVKEPRRISNGGVDARIWSGSAVERVKKYKAARYMKGRGPKKKEKA